MKKILVVDDQEDILEIICELLQDSFDCEIISTVDSKVALEHLSQQQFAAVCSDFIMPEYTGVDILKIMRESNGPNKETPFFLLTGNDTDARTKVNGYELVFVLDKVAEINNLVTILEKYVS